MFEHSYDDLRSYFGTCGLGSSAIPIIKVKQPKLFRQYNDSERRSWLSDASEAMSTGQTQISLLNICFL